MSKFDYATFTGDYPVVVSKERYTEQQAVEIARKELGADDVEKFDGYVRYGYGIDDDDIATGVRNTWWLTLSSICPKRCCPVWAFRVRRTDNEKDVLLSIKPQYCELISNGEKTIEVRKTRPTIETPFKCYIYCTGKPNLWKSKHGIIPDCRYNRITDDIPDILLNKKVIGEFICDRIFQYSTGNVEGIDISDEDIVAGSCLSKQEIGNYEFSAPQKDFCMYRVGVYGWHISELVIYDRPRDLESFKITKPPQSWRYVEEI